MSNKIYVISDLHLGHERMARHRGFDVTSDMFDVIMYNWNFFVKKNDTVWILGDITMEKKAYYPLLDQLNGKKRVVLGNHDRRQDVPELLKHVDYVCSSAQVNGFILTHIPIHPTQLGRFGKNIHGHTHDKFVRKWYGEKDKRYINVCAEVINYTPVEIKSLK